MCLRRRHLALERRRDPLVVRRLRVSRGSRQLALPQLRLQPRLRLVRRQLAGRLLGDLFLETIARRIPTVNRITFDISAHADGACRDPGVDSEGAYNILVIIIILL